MPTLVQTALNLSYCVRASRALGATEEELEELKVAIVNLAKACITLKEYGQD